MDKGLGIENEVNQSLGQDERSLSPTEKIQKENELLIQTLTAKNEQINHFAYVASHDLKEPLRTITSFIEIIKEDYGSKLDAEAMQYFGFIDGAVDRMQKLISGLLIYSRLGNSGDKETVDLNSCLKNIKENLALQISEQEAVFNCDDLPLVFGHKVELTQLFQNLISNALKFRKKEVSPVISIATKDIGEFHEFSVSDNGIGIKEAKISEIFEMFKRLNSTKHFEGQGIGLSFCQKIVELHLGHIWATSTYGQGTTIHFTLKKQQ